MSRQAQNVAGVLATLGVLVGCHRVQASYEPLTVLQPTTVDAYRATQFFDQDAAAILKAGGAPIGELQSVSVDVVNDGALKMAAARGGTHLIRTRKDLESAYLQFSRARADANCAAAADTPECGALYRDAAFVKIADLPRVRLMVWRVPCENWGRLPEELRPVSYTGCTHDPFDRTPIKVGSKPMAGAQQAPSTATGAIGGAPPAPPPETDDLLDDNCQAVPSAKEFLPFERTEAMKAFQSAEQESLKCNWSDHAVTLVITFGPAGCLRQIHIDDERNDAKFDTCVVDAFSNVSVPPFRGTAVTVSKHLGVQ